MVDPRVWILIGCLGFMAIFIGSLISCSYYKKHMRAGNRANRNNGPGGPRGDGGGGVGSHSGGSRGQTTHGDGGRSDS
ncbi:hypothetical protein F4779DRAFT_619915 [Xylariaceae sp. FL0662B]|nr:hypothetical protein F4779DRAFT_619915 [Xylariaceae sp. FL0662B]